MTDEAYQPLDVDTSWETILDDVLAEIEAEFPGIDLSRRSTLEVALAAAFARRAAETNNLVARRADNLFRFMGQRVDGVAQITGTRATGTAQLTAVDDSGWNIPSGTVVGVRVTGDELVAFATDETLTIPSGDTSGEVGVTAEEIGEHANGLTGELEIVDSLAALDSAELVGETSGGEDEETDDEYLNRLARRRELAAEVPILPSDFPPFAREVAGVHRALAVDGYDPDADSHGNERTVAIALVDSDGLPVDQAVHDEVQSDLEARRETNFVVHTFDPTYTAVAVELVVRAEDGWTDQAAVDSAVAAVEAFLHPATWAGGDEDPPSWRVRDMVRYLEVAAVASAADGVDFLEELTLDGASDDVPLSGEAPLPAPQEDPTGSDPWTEATTVTGSASS